MDVMGSIELEDIKSQIKQVLGGLLEMIRLKSRQILVVGCSSSEIDSFKAGFHSSGDIGMATLSALNEGLKPLEIFLATQCCGHLNRALIPGKEAAEHYGYEAAGVVPQPKAGGSFTTATYAALGHPVAVEYIEVHAGTNIGDILIGMYLRGVAVPMRIQTRGVGSAHVICTRARPRLIGGARTYCDGGHM